MSWLDEAVREQDKRMQWAQHQASRIAPIMQRNLMDVAARFFEQGELAGPSISVSDKDQRFDLLWEVRAGASPNDNLVSVDVCLYRTSWHDPRETCTVQFFCRLKQHCASHPGKHVFANASQSFEFSKGADVETVLQTCLAAAYLELRQRHADAVAYYGP